MKILSTRFVYERPFKRQYLSVYMFMCYSEKNLFLPKILTTWGLRICITGGAQLPGPVFKCFVDISLKNMYFIINKVLTNVCNV